MHRTHRRGTSQQITKSARYRQPHNNLIDLKQNYAFSSEHTRSTALTIYKTKQKQKSLPHPQHKQKQKDKKIKKQSKNIYATIKNLQNQQWKQQQAPYTPEQVLKFYYGMLDNNQREQIKQYRNIWFIGHNRNKFNRQQGIKKTINQEGFLGYQKGGHISYRYEIIQKINRGSFGEVLKVYDHKNKQYQALKIVKKMPELIKQTFIQISILTSIKQKDKGDMSGIVRIKDFTIFRQHICIAFELMDANLYELLHANQFKGLTESFVRIFAIQMLNSLNFLQKMNIVHCDIKPENFVLKVWGKSGIKLIDFGTSCYQDQQVYTYIQSRYYRAPQIIFHRPYTTAIDMWSFGCLMAQLSFGRPLFPGNTDLHQLIYMISLLGYPEQQFSHQCSTQIEIIRQKKYLQKDQSGRISKETLQRFERDTGNRLNQQSLKSLEERFEGHMFPFVHFLKQILKWDPKDRINPSQALQHPWVTNGLPEQIRQLYTVYQNLNKSQQKQVLAKKKKRTKSKSKSKSREKSQQKNVSIQKNTNSPTKNSINFGKNQSKTLKFDVSNSLASNKYKKTRNSIQKSCNQKPNKSPYNKKNKI